MSNNNVENELREKEKEIANIIAYQFPLDSQQHNETNNEIISENNNNNSLATTENLASSSSSSNHNKKTKLKDMRNIFDNINTLQFGSETFDLLYNIITTLKPISKSIFQPKFDNDSFGDTEMIEFKRKRDFILSFDGCTDDKRLNELRNMLLSWNKKGLSLLCNLFELKDQNSKSFNTRSNLNVMVEMILSFLTHPQDLIPQSMEERKKPKIAKEFKSIFHEKSNNSNNNNINNNNNTNNNGHHGKKNEHDDYENWVQCNKCGKWRNLHDKKSEEIPTVWVCEMNPIPRLASCSVPEEDVNDQYMLNEREILVYKNNYNEDSILGIIHYEKNHTIEDIRNIIKTELNEDPSNLYKRDFIPILPTQNNKNASFFFRSEKDFITVKTYLSDTIKNED